MLFHRYFFPAAAAIVAMVGFTPLSRATQPPNILFCISDDQSFPHASAYGCPWVQTPAFDRVAREGLLFMRAYTPNSKCAPSRACILTGRNSWQLEAAANHGGYFPPNFRSVFEALGAKGYATGFTGKGWAPGSPGIVNGRPRELTGPAFNRLKSKPPTGDISPIDYAANFAEFLAQKPAGQPFCFWYGGNEPHRSYEAGSGARIGRKSTAQIDRVPAFWPDDDVVRNDLLDYAFEIEHFDLHLARILEALERVGELDNTIIIVTADNGMPFPRAKGASYELSDHLPLAIRWGRGILQPGRRMEGLVSFIDFAPTLLDVAGLTAAQLGMSPVQGRSLVPIFRAASDGWDQVFIGQERHDVGRPEDVGYPVRGIFTRDYLYLHNFEPSRWPMCDPITGYLNTDGSPTKTLILAQNRLGINHWLWELNFGRRPAEELYDLRRDPDCLVNLAGVPALTATREALKEHLMAELKDEGDPRLAGQGIQFDRYPYAGPPKNFFARYILQGEKVPTYWVEDTDFEKPDFDPERPLRENAKSTQPKP